MILIADSGSTKTNWLIPNLEGSGEIFSTIGYNPHFIAGPAMVNDMRANLLPQLPASPSMFKAIYFYGAGCSTEHDCAKVESAIREVFPKTAIHVDHDLMGAARALCGREPGVACILGTGSNSCLYDGKDIIDNVVALGFTMGDEGGGAELGRRLLKSFFYREMPADIRAAFLEQHEMTKEILLDNIYSKPLPNRWCASFSAFCGEHRRHPFIQGLIRSNLHDFVFRQVSRYDEAHKMPVHFIGSVAFHFRDELSDVLNEAGLQLGQVLKNPIYKMAEFHLQDVAVREDI